MHIDSYQFGRIVIDGQSYSSDCLIISGVVHDNWWRKEGHSLAIEDLQPVIEAQPSILVVGCGASGMMQVPRETQQFLQQHNIQPEQLDTAAAAERFNELSKQGINVAAAMHLTC